MAELINRGKARLVGDKFYRPFDYGYVKNTPLKREQLSVSIDLPGTYEDPSYDIRDHVRANDDPYQRRGDRYVGRVVTSTDTARPRVFSPEGISSRALYFLMAALAVSVLIICMITEGRVMASQNRTAAMMTRRDSMETVIGNLRAEKAEADSEVEIITRAVGQGMVSSKGIKSLDLRVPERVEMMLNDVHVIRNGRMHLLGK